ncbi:DNA alkylation repair protein [Bacteroidota bacterium]|nr:DNA alkylation repair protein [Bacteroidota bacterium]
MKSIELIKSLEKEFNKHSNPSIARSQKAYMRNQFEFLGLTANKRREIQNTFFQNLEINDLNKFIYELWNLNKRDYQYLGQELLYSNHKNFKVGDIKLIEYIIINKSWWDTIDFLSPKILGKYFKLYPDEIEKNTQKWILSNNIWLKRSAILFQLKYKETLNIDLLNRIIIPLSNSKEFFINKAIGWILREYGKTNKEWVINFVKKNKLSNLSNREALKHINKN